MFDMDGDVIGGLVVVKSVSVFDKVCDIVSIIV